MGEDVDFLWRVRILAELLGLGWGRRLETLQDLTGIRCCRSDSVHFSPDSRTPRSARCVQHPEQLASDGRREAGSRGLQGRFDKGASRLLDGLSGHPRRLSR